MSDTISRKGKVLFLPDDVEAVTLTAIRKVFYTEEEKQEYDTKDDFYTSLSMGFFIPKDCDGYDVLSGNSYILNDNNEWELVQNQVPQQEERIGNPEDFNAFGPFGGSEEFFESETDDAL